MLEFIYFYNTGLGTPVIEPGDLFINRMSWTCSESYLGTGLEWAEGGIFLKPVVNIIYSSY